MEEERGVLILVWTRRGHRLQSISGNVSAMSSRRCENPICSELLVLGDFPNLHLARRPVVGYLNRSMLASNRLCNTSIINVY